MRTKLLLFLISKTYAPLGRTPFFHPLWLLFSLHSTSYCLTVIACLSPCLRLKTFWTEAFLAEFPAHLLDSKTHRCMLANVSALILGRAHAASCLQYANETHSGAIVDKLHLFSQTKTEDFAESRIIEFGHVQNVPKQSIF